MKKTDLLKTILICFAIYIVLSWIIPVGSYSTGAFVAGKTIPVGIFELFYYPFITIGTVIQYGIVFLAIGGFYGVMNKTGVYQKIVDGIVKKYNKKEQHFLIITIISLAILSSISGLPLALFAVVPFLMTVILKLGYNKMIAFVSTVGAILIGGVGATYGLETIAHSNAILELDPNNNILTKIILLILVTFLLIMYVLNSIKKDNKLKKDEEKAEIPLLEKGVNTKKSSLPLIIIFSTTIIILLVSMYNWYYGLEFLFFNELYEKLIAIKIGEYELFKNLIGDISPIGYWGTYEMSAVLLISSLLIGWIYSLKITETVSAFIEGCQKMIKVAFFAVLANIIFTLMLANSDAEMLSSINNWLLSLFDNFNIFIVAIISMIGTFFYNNFYYLGNIIIPPIASTAATQPEGITGVIGILVQAISSLTTLIVPTSFILIAGLSYLDISFKEWVKYIWKFLLEILILILIISVILIIIL